MVDNSFFVYVIKSKEGLHYTGYTSDLEKRIKQHNDKSLSFWTKRGSGWKLIFFKEFKSSSEAMNYEKFLKSGQGQIFLKKNVKSY